MIKEKKKYVILPINDKWVVCLKKKQVSSGFETRQKAVEHIRFLKSR